MKLKINNYTRDSHGRFSSKTLKIMFYIVMIAFVLLVAYISQIKPKVEYVDRKTTEIVIVNTTQQIIDNEINDILNVLEKCESSGDANAINWNDNGVGKNRASFGAYMFKVGTIQQFIKGISDFEAIKLAGDKAESRKLASIIIFETKGGIYNWRNCMDKHGLLKRVNFVLDLKSKIK